ncbi:MAG TPA: hypothetical protein VFG19_04425, partial [Geobacteraceae bacterium]|nr:hypothetical protein [Geobacteraceae bacterium]
ISPVSCPQIFEKNMLKNIIVEYKAIPCHMQHNITSLQLNEIICIYQPYICDLSTEAQKKCRCILFYIFLLQSTWQFAV